MSVWHIPLNPAQPLTQAEWAVLSEDERARARKFVHDHLRLWFGRRRAALRTILAGYIGQDPADIAFEYHYNGKPTVIDPGQAPDLSFSCSHSGNLAVVAVTTRPIGVDIEQVRPLPDLAGLLNTVCTDREKQSLGLLDAAHLMDGFFRIWTAKEAVIKMTGAGLSTPLGQIETNRFDDGPIAVPGGVVCRLADLRCGAGYRATLAYEATGASPDVGHIRFAHSASS